MNYGPHVNPPRKRSGSDKLNMLLIAAAVLFGIVLLAFVFISALSGGTHSSVTEPPVLTVGGQTDTSDWTGPSATSDAGTQTGDLTGGGDTTTADVVVWDGCRPNVTPGAPSLAGKIGSQFAILVDMHTGDVLAQLSPDQQMYPASMTKIMTLIVAFENAPDLAATFTVTGDIVSHVYQANGSNVGLVADEKVTLVDLMYATMLPSACDASEALGCFVAGSEAAFADMMNAKAKELGMTGTHFVNTSGLHDPDHYSTARDVATMLIYALKNDFLRRIICSQTYEMHATAAHPERSIKSTLFKEISEYTGSRTLRGVNLLGGKTGTETAAGKCLASLAVSTTDTSHEFVLVTGKAPNSTGLIDDTYYIYSNFAH